MYHRDLNEDDEDYDPMEHGRRNLIFGKYKAREYFRGQTVLRLYYLYTNDNEYFDEEHGLVMKCYNKKSFFPDTYDILME